MAGEALVLEQTPTASQIDAYQGNANLAFGPDGNALDPGDKDISAITSQALQQANAQRFQWEIKQHDQKIKDRDAALDLFSKAELKGDIDEKDRPRLTAIYDDIEKEFLANPNLLNDPKAYTNIQKRIKEFNNLGAVANTRSAEFAKQRLDIANTLDPQLKEKKQAHLNSEISKGIEHLPSPYLNELDPDEKNFTGSNMIVIKRDLGKDERGLPTVTETSRTDVKGIIDRYSPAAYLEGNNKTLPDQAAIRAKSILAKPELTSEAYMTSANKKLAEINAENGFKPGDKYFLTPYAVQNPDGTWVIDNNPIELNKKVHVLSEYKESKGPATLDKASQDLLVQQANIEQSKASASASRANAAQSYNAIDIANKKLPYELEQIKANTEKTKMEGGDITSLQNQMVFAKVGSDAITAFSDASNSKNKVQASFVLSGNAINDLGLSPLSELVKVPITNSLAKEMLTQVSLDKDGKKIESAPNAIYMIKDPTDPSKNRLVGVNSSKGIVSSYGLNDGATNLASQRLGNTTGFNQPKIQAGVDEYITKFTSPVNTQGEDLVITQEEEIANYKPVASDMETYKVGSETGYYKWVNQNGARRRAVYRKNNGKLTFVGWK